MSFPNIHSLFLLQKPLIYSDYIILPPRHSPKFSKFGLDLVQKFSFKLPQPLIFLNFSRKATYCRVHNKRSVILYIFFIPIFGIISIIDKNTVSFFSRNILSSPIRHSLTIIFVLVPLHKIFHNLIYCFNYCFYSNRKSANSNHKSRTIFN